MKNKLIEISKKIGKEELRTYPRYACMSCGNKTFGLCKTNDSMFPDIICIKCGGIRQI